MKHWILLLMLFAVASTSVAVAQDVGISNIVHTPATPSASGDPVTLSVTVMNNGPGSATGVQVAIALASELSYVSDDGGGSYNSGTGTWTISTIADGGSATLNINTTFAPGNLYAGIVASSTAYIGQPDSDKSNNSTSACLGSPIPICAGSSAVFELSVPTSVSDGTTSYPLTNFEWFKDGVSQGPPSAVNTFNVTAAGAYTVTAEYSNGATVCPYSGCCPVVFIDAPAPTATITPDPTICEGETTLLQASGGVSYQWSTGETTTSISVSPNANTPYSVTVTDANGCTASASSNVIVVPAPEAGSPGGGTVCNVASEGTTTVDLLTLLSATAEPGGTFVATGGAPALSGTTFDGTGLPTNAVYTYQYVVTGNAPCADDFAVITITVLDCEECPPLPVDFSYPTPVCDGSGLLSPTTPGTPGGTWTAAPVAPSVGAINIDPLNGDIDLSTTDAGTYSITYTIAATATCPAQSHSFELTIIVPVDAGVDNTGTVCNDATEGTTTQDLDLLLAAGVSGGTWSAVGAAPAPDGAGVIDGAGLTAGTQLVYNYTLVGTTPCPDDVATITITVNDCLTCPNPPTADFALTSPVCETITTISPVLAAGATSGVWTASPAGLAIDPATGTINPTASAVGNYTVTNTVVAAGACPQAVATADIEIVGQPDAGANNTVSVCNTPLSGSTTTDLDDALSAGVTGGNWSAVTVGAPAIGAGNVIDGNGLTVGATFVYAYTITATTPCADDIAEVTVTIADCDDPASLGDIVWYDMDADGVQDAGEPGIQGVTVTLYNGDGTPTGLTDVTDNFGAYLFDNLNPGDYYVVFSTPAGYTPSDSNQGGDDTTDSDAGVGGQSHTTNLSPGEHDPTIDAGFYLPASLGDFVWLDSDADGVQDAGEVGLAGVTVTLFNGDGTATGLSTTTDIIGFYQFDDLQPGDYYVVFGAPSGYDASPANQGGDDATDSDAGVGGQSHTTTLSPGEHDPTIDAGFYQPASLGDFVWLDNDGDGVQDPGEPGIPGVTVTLTLPDGTTLTTVTDNDGLYLFDGLVPGTYTVSVPATVDGNNPTTPITLTTTLSSGEHDPTLDFGYEPPTPLSSLGDFVWLDSDADGVQDAGEVGLAGVTVTLFNGDGTATGLSTTTDIIGFYQFDDLQPGDYYVVFGAPSGYDASPANQGGDDATDSDAGVGGQSHTTTLSPGEHDPTIDAGFYQPASLGDFVWLDNDGDGVQDPGEPGIPGVTVTLTLPDGTTLTTVTDNDGLYLFDGLVPGTYTVSVPATVDGNNPTTPITLTTTLSSGEHDPTLDFGYEPPTPLSSLGDFVWLDSDADGVQDAGEVGLAGVTVTLFNGDGTATGLSTTTDIIGFYQFDDLQPGDYYVVFGAPSGYDASPANQGGDDATDSDAGVGGQSHTTTLSPGEHDPTIDAGFYQPASLGDFVWLDNDGDGVQDPGEPGIPGVTVTLTLPDGTTLTTVTDNDGLYLFDGLVPGTYTVSVPATVDGNNPTTPITLTTTLSSGEHDPTLDFGYEPPTPLSSLGDFVWLDSDADGVQDAGEVGLAGVTVTLFNGDGTATGLSTTTDIIGFYQFDDLQPGDYYVVFGAPSGYDASPANQGGDDATDSDAGVGGQSHTTTLSPGEHDPTIDAGFYQPASLGDFVWLDNDGDGVQDPGEPGIPGVTVTLTLPDGTTLTTVTNDDGFYLFDGLVPGTYTVSVPATVDGNNPTTPITLTTTLSSGEHDPTLDFGYEPPTPLSSLGDFVWLDSDADGVQDAGEVGLAGVTVTLFNGDGTATGLSTTTDATGFYQFDDLQPGDYYVVFGAPSGYDASPANQGGDDATDSDAGVGGQSHTTTLSPGEHDPTIDAGFYQPASLGDFVWLDNDGDGVQDPGEPGIPGVTVTLTLPDGTTLTTVTDDDGMYLFDGLVPGTYTVSVPATVDGNNPTTPITITTTLTSGEEDLTNDFGYEPPASLGDFVWLDSDADGVQDAGEVGLAGVTVTLFNGDGTATGLSTTTDATGFYQFDDLQPGDYYVVFGAPSGYDASPANQGGDDATDSDAGVGGQSHTTTLSPGEHDPTIDAGFYQPASLGDFVWLDNDGDGVQDPGEPGIPGVTVTLTLPDGTTLTTVTDNDGLYLFDGLVPGTYTVSVPATVDGNNPTTPITITTTLTSGEEDLTNDFGYEPNLASIGDCVWLDSDADGVQDVGEVGINDVWVYLYSGTGELLDSMQTIDGPLGIGGYYTFYNLTPGDYYVVFGNPGAQYTLTLANQGNDFFDSDATLMSGLYQSGIYNLSPGESDSSVDAGFYQTASIGDFVWLDNDGDGVQDPGEPGIPGVTVTLTLPDGTTLTTVTDDDGMYLFDGLVPGTYTVSVPATVNGNNPSTPITITTTLTSGEEDLTNDFGYEPLLGSIGNFVWLDADVDGIQDLGEPGIAGVQVQLFNAETGALVGTQTTGANGQYLFDELPAGDYFLTFTNPNATHVVTLSNQGANDNTDSDINPNGTTATVTLSPGEDDLSIDAGYYPPAGLGDFVWFDENFNYIQDIGEPGIPGVLVSLYDAAGNLIDQTMTDANGFYLFSNLTPGTYTVTVPFFGPNGFLLEGVTGQTTTLLPGETDLTIDFPYIQDPGGGQEIPEECTEIFTPIQLCVELEPGEVVVEELTSTTFNCNITGSTEECVTYYPFPGFEGVDTVYIAICQIDNPLVCHYEPIIVNVGCIAPDANHDWAHIYGNSVSFNGSNSADANGYDGVVLPVITNDNETCDTGMTVTQITNDPDHGTVTITPTGGINYVPNDGYTGTDQFIYLLCNECGSCDTAVVDIIIDPQPEPCESEDLTICTPQFTAVTICPEFCLEGDYNIVSTNTIFDCSISILGDCIIYTPLPAFIGQDTIEIVACTPAGVCDTIYVNMTVGNCSGCETWETEICTVPMEQNIICPEFCLDGDWTLEQVHTTFSCSIQLIDNCVRYTALPLYSGADTIMMIACNAAGVCDTAWAYIQVGGCGGNNPPLANNDTATSTGGAAVTIDVTNNDSDPDADPLTVVMFTQPEHGTVTQVGNQLIYTPDEGFEGNDTFTYQVCDDEGLCDMATVTVTVLDNACEDEIFLCAEPSQPIVLCPDFCGLGNGDITLTSVRTTFNCSIMILDDGCFRYTALPLFAGEETIEVVGCNTMGVCDTIHYTVNVTADCDDMGGGEQGGKIESEQPSINHIGLTIDGVVPVPAVTYTDLKFTTDEGTVKVVIYDINGKLTEQRTVETVKGANTLRIDIADYAAGMYVISIQTDTEAATTKFVKQQ